MVSICCYIVHVVLFAFFYTCEVDAVPFNSGTIPRPNLPISLPRPTPQTIGPIEITDKAATVTGSPVPSARLPPHGKAGVVNEPVAGFSTVNMVIKIWALSPLPAGTDEPGASPDDERLYLSPTAEEENVMPTPAEEFSLLPTPVEEFYLLPTPGEEFSLLSTPGEDFPLVPTPGEEFPLLPVPLGDFPPLPTPTANGKEEEKGLPGSEDTCFPGSGIVTLEGGTQRQLRDVRIGDSIQYGPGKFSTVFMFTHRTEQVFTLFVSIRAVGGNGVVSVVHLTQHHYIYRNESLVEAKAVRVGDLVELASGEKAHVVDVGCVILRGLFNPQTISGDIVVNGVRASTYTKAIPISLAHAALTPLRWSFRVFGWWTSTFEHGTPGILLWK